MAAGTPCHGDADSVCLGVPTDAHTEEASRAPHLSSLSPEHKPPGSLPVRGHSCPYTFSDSPELKPWGSIPSAESPGSFSGR